MAATIQGKVQLTPLPGGNGKVMQQGTVKFSGANTTGNLKLLLKGLESLQFTAAGGQSFACGPAIADGLLLVPASGEVAITQIYDADDAVYSYTAIGF